MHCRSHCPPGQTPPPLRLANTPTPPLGRHPTPPLVRHPTPLLVRHPLDRPSWADTLPGQTSPWADNPLWSMSGWYAFYWNTFFFFFFNLHAAFYIGYTSLDVHAQHQSVVDPGFPDGEGGTNPLVRDKTYYLA